MGQKKQEPQTNPVLPSYNVIFERFWDTMLKNQEINERQLEESEKKFLLQMEERNRQLRDSDFRFQQKLDEKNRQVNESGYKFYQKLEKNRQKYREESGHAEHESTEASASGGLLKKINKIISKKEEKEGGLLIVKQFRELGYHFDDVCPGGRKILDDRGNIKTEISFILENTDCIMAIEKCAKPKKQNIENHINSLSILRDYRDKYHDRRRIFGGVMGKDFKDTEKQAILEAGLFTIEQNGNMIKIEMPKGVPREW